MNKHIGAEIITGKAVFEDGVECDSCLGSGRHEDGYACEDCSGRGFNRECNFCGRVFDSDPADAFKTKWGHRVWVCRRCQTLGAPYNSREWRE